MQQGVSCRYKEEHEWSVSICHIRMVNSGTKLKLGKEAGGFSEVSGFDASIDVIEYREGDIVQTSMKIPGLKKYGNITLKQGLATSRVS